jgi:uncharacterized protein YcfJ
MNKSLITGLIAGAIVATAGGAVAGYKFLRGPEFAQVVDVKAVTKTIRTPRQECHQEQVTQQAPTRDPHQITGSVLGAVVGGVLGHQVGGGSGKKIATVAGAAAGGYAGNRVQQGMQERRTVTTIEQRCETVYDSHEERVGYDVRYRLGDEEGKVRMDHDPGERIPVRDGKLVTEAPQPGESKTTTG